MKQLKYLGEKDIMTVNLKGKKKSVRNVPHYGMGKTEYIEPIDVCYADLLQMAEEIVVALKELKKIRHEEEMDWQSRKGAK